MPTLFTKAAGEAMRNGVIPKEMEDKWFIYHEGGRLNFHRSWTGAHIFALRLEGSPGGVRVVDGWVSRDATHYRSNGLEEDRKRVVQLIHAYFGD